MYFWFILTAIFGTSSYLILLNYLDAVSEKKYTRNYKIIGVISTFLAIIFLLVSFSAFF